MDLIPADAEFNSEFSFDRVGDGEAAFVKTVKNPEINPALKTVLLQTDNLFLIIIERLLKALSKSLINKFCQRRNFKKILVLHCNSNGSAELFEGLVVL